MALGPAIALVVVVTVPSYRLGKRMATPLAQRNATPEEQAERKRQRAARRKAELAALTRRERALFYAYYAFLLPAMPVGILLTLYGQGTTRTVGLVLLVIAVLLMAVPVGPIFRGRAKQRKQPRSA